MNKTENVDFMSYAAGRGYVKMLKNAEYLLSTFQTLLILNNSNAAMLITSTRMLGNNANINH